MGKEPLRSVRFGPWLYIRTYHDGYHLFPEEMLFDLEDDPYEQHNLADSKPDVCKEAVYLLNRRHDDTMKSMPYDVDPLWTVIKEGGPYHARGHLRAYCERLERTGRGWAIPELGTPISSGIYRRGMPYVLLPKLLLNTLNRVV